jgi:[histone H3]-dimethyl-L-lysine9 demethylase
MLTFCSKGYSLSFIATDSPAPANEGEPRPAPKPQTGVSTPLQPELQFARCMSNRYRTDSFPRCVSCTRRWAGDTCRFQGIRFFLKDNQKNVVGISFIEGERPDAPSMDFPVKWNVPLQPSHIRRTKVRTFEFSPPAGFSQSYLKWTVARALLPTLKEELAHLDIKEIIKRPRESEVRATCGKSTFLTFSFVTDGLKNSRYMHDFDFLE